MAWIQWRANRLADLLAKAAASKHRLPARVFTLLKQADILHRHQAALLGAVTYQANHHTQADGDTPRRDSAGQKPRRPRTWRRYAPQQQSTSTTAASSSSTHTEALRRPPPTSRLVGREKRRRQADDHKLAQALVDARRVASHLASSTLRPVAAPVTAAERLEALRARVAAKQDIRL